MRKYMSHLKMSVVFALALGFALLLYADTVKISRITSGIISIGGKTAVVSDSPTNEYKAIQVTATVSGAATAYTNTFASVFDAAPVIVMGVKSGQLTGYGSLNTVTHNATNLIVAGLSTNLSTGTNGLPFIIYGNSRSGILQ